MDFAMARGDWLRRMRVEMQGCAPGQERRAAVGVRAALPKPPLRSIGVGEASISTLVTAAGRSVTQAAAMASA